VTAITIRTPRPPAPPSKLAILGPVIKKPYQEQLALGIPQRFAHRIWSRLTVLRKKRERAEIDAVYKGPRRKKATTA
jgi:hypothetical protein